MNIYSISTIVVLGFLAAYKVKSLLFAAKQIKIKNINLYGLNFGLFTSYVRFYIDVDIQNNSKEKFNITPDLITILDQNENVLSTITPPKNTFNLAPEKIYTLQNIRIDLPYSKIKHLGTNLVNRALIARVKLKVSGAPVTFDKPIVLK